MSATVPELLRGYSQGLYSTWLWYRPFRVLFDAGEGVALRLQNSAFGIRYVFLSHGHVDHLSGLPSLVNIRNSAMGDTSSPLTVVHPKGDALIGAMRDYLERSNSSLTYPLEWREVGPGDRVTIDETRSVETFPTEHTRGQPSVGYRVLEHRRRLRAELRDRPEAEIREIVRQRGPAAVREAYDHALLVYGGDGMAPAREYLDGADLACLDATFLDLADRDRPNHATVGEAVAAAVEAGVAALVLYHFSGRYRTREIRDAVRGARESAGYRGDVYILWRDRLLNVSDT